MSGNIFLICDEKIYMLWSIVLQKSFAKQAHQSYLKILQIRSMSQWQECGVWIFIHWNCSNKWYRHYWHERHLLITSRINMLNDSSKNHQINNFYDLGKLKDIGCFNLLTNFGPWKRWIKNRSVAIYRTTTVLSQLMQIRKRENNTTNECITMYWIDNLFTLQPKLVTLLRTW